MESLTCFTRSFCNTALGVHKWVATFAMASLLAACNPERIIDAETKPKLSVCHMQGSVGTATDILLSDLAGHKTHGDYVTSLEVNRLPDGGDSIHFTRITDALSAARAGRIARAELDKAMCRITISVASGTYSGSTAQSSDPLFERFPLVIDVPDITLKGALRMQVDAEGRATGVGEGTDVTTFAPSPALILAGSSAQTAVSEKIIILNGHPDGPMGHGAIIEGFAFQSGRTTTDTTTGGAGIFALRVRDIALRGNRFEGGFNSSIDLGASSGIVERNHLSGLGSSCDICLAGPGDYVARDNRILGGGIPGVLILPTAVVPPPPGVEPLTLPTTALVTAVVSNNEVRGHVRKPVGVGLRIGAVGLGAPNVAGTSKVTFSANNLVGNTFGIIIDGAFVGTGLRRGDIEVVTSGNTISQSCQADLLVSLSISVVGLGLSNGSYLQNSTYNITLGSDILWDKAWFANAPATSNKLIVNGQTIASGSRTAYDATRVCP